MQEVDINLHGKTYKVKYDPSDGSAIKAGIEHLSKNMDSEAVHDLFNNAHLDADGRSRLDFYDKPNGIDRSLRVSYDGSGVYHLRKAA